MTARIGNVGILVMMQIPGSEFKEILIASSRSGVVENVSYYIAKVFTFVSYI